jgi:hypothetical protein
MLDLSRPCDACGKMIGGARNANLCSSEENAQCAAENLGSAEGCKVEEYKLFEKPLTTKSTECGSQERTRNGQSFKLLVD